MESDEHVGEINSPPSGKERLKPSGNIGGGGDVLTIK
jgi:hypothetical protein